MSAARATRIAAVVAVLFAAARVIWFATVHEKPALGSEAADLHRSMFYHWGLRGHLGWSWWDQLAQDGFKPPLWYTLVPLLAAGSTVLSLAPYLLLNATLLGLLALGVHRLARVCSGGVDAPVGAFAVLILLGLPGVQGRFVVVGVEPLHAVLLVAVLLGLFRVRREGALPVLGLGLALGAGLLAKWSFAVYAAGPWLWELARAARDRDGRCGARLAASGAIGLSLFLLWWIPFADASQIVATAVAEPTLASDPVGRRLYYVRALGATLGGGVLIAPLVGLLWVRSGVPYRRVGALVAAIVSLLAVHWLLPHKELRYLLPMLGPAAVLLAIPLGEIAGGRTRFPRGSASVVLLPIILTAVSGAGGPRLQPLDRELRLAPDRSAYGLEAIVEHPSLGTRARNVVTYSMPEEPVAPAMTALHWAFYGRNAVPTLSRGNHEDLTARAAAFDLERSTHVVVSRAPGDQEVAALRSMGFRRVVESAPVDLLEFSDLDLWVLDPRASPPKRGPGPPPPR